MEGLVGERQNIRRDDDVRGELQRFGRAHVVGQFKAPGRPAALGWRNPRGRRIDASMLSTSNTIGTMPTTRSSTAAASQLVHPRFEMPETTNRSMRRSPHSGRP